MRLFLDACTLIYRFEGTEPFRLAAIDKVANLSAQQTTVELVVSRLSVLECRVKPLREGHAKLLQRYDDFFAAAHIVELDSAVVEAATRLRAHYGLKTPDALQAACALAVSDRPVFVTADASFAKVAALDIQLIRVD